MSMPLSPHSTPSIVAWQEIDTILCAASFKSFRGQQREEELIDSSATTSYCYLKTEKLRASSTAPVLLEKQQPLPLQGNSGNCSLSMSKQFLEEATCKIKVQGQHCCLAPSSAIGQCCKLERLLQPSSRLYYPYCLLKIWYEPRRLILVNASGLKG